MTETDSVRNVASSNGAPEDHAPGDKTNMWGADIKIDNLDVGSNIREVGVTPELVGLAKSIEAQGILQPILVQVQAPGTKPLYRVIDGHRRVAAAKQLGLKEVPCIVRSHVPHEIIDAQLVANLHRQDLTPLEEAAAYKAWLDKTGKEQKELARIVSRSPSHISNRIRLLKLGNRAQLALQEGLISESTAEYLLSVPEELKGLQAEIVDEGLKTLKQGWRLNWESLVRNRISDRKSRDEAERMLSKATVKKCPKCGGAPIRLGYSHDIFQCKSWHEWEMNPAPKEKPNRKAGRSKKSGVVSESSKRALETKARELAFLSEDPVVRSAHTPAQILMGLLKGNDEQVLRVYFDSDQADESEVPRHLMSGVRSIARIVVVLRDPPMKETMWRADRVSYSTGDKTQVGVYGHDPASKAKTRTAFTHWEESSLPRAARKPSKDYHVDPKILDGTVGQVLDRFKGLGPESLEQLRDVELRGKKRTGVLDDIENRLLIGKSHRFPRWNVY